MAVCRLGHPVWIEKYFVPGVQFKFTVAVLYAVQAAEDETGTRPEEFVASVLMSDQRRIMPSIRELNHMCFKIQDPHPAGHEHFRFIIFTQGCIRALSGTDGF